MSQVGSLATNYLFRKASSLNIPLGATFELSPVCNLSCKMCYVRMTRNDVEKLGGERTAEEWLDIARQCKEAGSLYLLLTGGEPFFYKDFKYLFEELTKMGFIISINSNGILIDDEMIEWLKENPPSKINITMYGASNETYKRLCNSSNGYDKVTYAIRKLKEAGITVIINLSLTPYNIEDYDKIREFAEEVDALLRPAAYMFPPIRRDKNSIGKNERFTPQDAAIHTIKAEIDKNGIDAFCKNASMIDNELKMGIEDIEKGIYKDGKVMPCRAGSSSFWINWQGKMTACGMMDEPIATYPFEEGFEISWEKIVEKIKSTKVLKECCNCKYMKVCKPCVAMCVAETGDMNKKPKYICEMNKVIVENSKKICEKNTPNM